MDAFFAAVEQAAKPSLRGKPVIVGGLGPRGVVATASYEARRFGVRSAMPMAQARRLAPNAAYLVPRFSVYREVSGQVMELLGRLSPLVEPLSLDEAFVDLEAGGTAYDAETARATGEQLRRDIVAATGLTGSVGLAGCKMLAKIASEQAKPNGLVLIEPGTERALLAPMGVRTLPGVGPATEEHLRRAGMTTVAHLAEAGEDELVRLLGRAHGAALYRMALGYDDRPVVAERDAKSVSVEDTFDVDLHDRVRVRWEVERLADRCVGRLRAAGRSGRTVVLKVRRYDFSTLTRSETLRGPTDDPAVVREAAARLLDAVDTTGGVRLLGVGVTGLADYTQEDLFAQAAAEEAAHAGDEQAAGAVTGTLPGEVGGPGGPAGPGTAGPGPAASAGDGDTTGSAGATADGGALQDGGERTAGARTDSGDSGDGAAGVLREGPGGQGRGRAADRVSVEARRVGAAGGGGVGVPPGRLGAQGDGAADQGPAGVGRVAPAPGGGVGVPRGETGGQGDGRSVYRRPTEQARMAVPRGGGAGASPGGSHGQGGGGAVGEAAAEGERMAGGGGVGMSPGEPDGQGGGLREVGRGTAGVGRVAAAGDGGSGAVGAGGRDVQGVSEGDVELRERRFAAGCDVRHAVYGPGWVQGSGLGRVTVRFEEPGSEPGRVRTFWMDDPELEFSEPLPLVPGGQCSSSSASLPKEVSGGGGPGRSRP